MNKLTSGLSGVAGEFLCAGEISRRGYIASLTMKNSRGIDILVSNAKATKSAGIQVKTNQGNGTTWVLNKKCESFYSDHLFYVFVNLNSGGVPEYFIVPSKVVSRFAENKHKKYLSTPGKKGQIRKDSLIRKFEDHQKNYLNQWGLLNLD